MLEDIKNGSF